MSQSKLMLSRSQLEAFLGKKDPDAIRAFELLFDYANGGKIGSVYFQGPHDASPGTLWPGTTWTDVSYEEANLTRRCVGDLAGAFFSGTPARLSVSVASGVPTISIVSGGSDYLGGGSGNINLIIAGGCTTQMVANATVANGVLTAINVTTAGAGYTSGAVAVYDGVVGHGDLTQWHWHIQRSRPDSSPSGNADNLYSPLGEVGGYLRSNYIGAVASMVTDTADGGGTPRGGAETSGAWVVVKKWRRTA